MRWPSFSIRVTFQKESNNNIRYSIIDRGNYMSDTELREELERLKAENAALKKGASKGLSLRVSEKGAVSVYGMGRFPVTLYKEQWAKLLDMADDIRAFIKENEGKLKTKGDE